jgi:AcrR family transcriptional regulator
MSLYRNFSSKDDLVAECLCEQEREFWAWWEATLEPYAGQPRRQIEALFDALEHQLGSETWSRGCVFANAAVELPDKHHPARKIILAHHEALRKRLRGLCNEMNARDPGALADGLLLLMAGVYMSCLVFEGPDFRKSLGESARAMLRSELGPPED